MGLVGLLKTKRKPAEVDFGRRDFLKRAVKGTAVGAGLLYGLNAIAPENADAGVDEIVDDATLLKYMNQPVEETLKDTNVTYVDDSNYQREVFQEHLPAGQRRPVMVLFYNNRSQLSQGNAALSRVISERFPQIKYCAYKISDGSSNDKFARNELRKKYGVRDTPAIMMYKNNNGTIENMGKDWNAAGGIKTLDFLKIKIQAYIKYIPQGMLK